MASGPGSKKSPTASPAAKPRKVDVVYGTSLTRAELEAYLPTGGEPIYRAWVYALEFESPLSLEEMAAKLESHAAEIADCTAVTFAKKEIGITFTRKQWAVGIDAKKGGFKLQLSFRSSGKRWGSNHALFVLLEQQILGIVGGRRTKLLMSHAKPGPRSG